MAMVYCRGCARQLHDTAHTCPQCGAPQFAAPASTGRGGYSWKAITSLIIGTLNVLTLLDESARSSDHLTGLALLSGVGLLLGILGINQKNAGSGMATAGAIMAVISLLCIIGLSAS